MPLESHWGGRCWGQGTGWKEVPRADEASAAKPWISQLRLASPGFSRSLGVPCCPVCHSMCDLPVWHWLCAVFLPNCTASRRCPTVGGCSLGFLGPWCPGTMPHLSPAPRDRAGILCCIGYVDTPVGPCPPPPPLPHLPDPYCHPACVDSLGIWG